MKEKRKIRVIAADDHDVYLDGLAMIFKQSQEIQLVATAFNGKELMELVKALEPDVVLTDLSMPVMDGITATRLITQQPKAPPIIAVSAFDDRLLIADAFDAGATGFIIKNAEREEIVAAVKNVYAGFPYYCKVTTGLLVQVFANTCFDPYAININYKFDAVEKEVIRMVCLEKSNKEIADAMSVSVRAIDAIRRKIMLKMEVQNMAGFTIYSLRNGLFRPENKR